MNRVSVVLPTYNRVDRLRRVLAGLEQQKDVPNKFEVIVVSDGSTDGTHDYLQSLETTLELAVVIQENQGPAVARNSGIARATGDIVLFIDDDVVPTPRMLSEHLRFHSGQGNLVVLGPMLSPLDFQLAPWVQWEQEMLMKQYRSMAAGEWEPTARQFYTGNTSLPRRFLVEAGGFDARFRRAEDVELAYRLARAGLRFVFNPCAVGYHYAERSYRSWREIPYIYGRNDVIFAHEGEGWLLKTMLEEFRERNQLIRLLVHLALDRPRLSTYVQGWLKQVAATAYRLRFRKVSRIAHSAIFNLRYYQGVADELGGRQQLIAMASEVNEEPVMYGLSR